MKKISFFLLILLSQAAFAQTKSTPLISFNAEMTAKFSLDQTTSKVTVVLTGPLDTWSSVGIGTATSLTSGDVYVYNGSVVDNINPTANPANEWNIVSNTITSEQRTVTMERNLTNSDLNDFQLAFDTTNSIEVVWSRSGDASAPAPNANRGSRTANFTSTLGIENSSFYDEVVIYPNPASNEVFVKTKSNLSKINIYNQTGSLLKAVKVSDNSNETNIKVNDLPKALYIFEIENDSEKTWKKVILK
jgi:hypothetical protein